MRASERDRPDIAAERADWPERIGAIAPERLVFIDESGITTKLGRSHARSPKGKRAHGRLPFSWKRLTVFGALAVSGMVAAMSIEAATTTPVFLAYLDHMLLPELKTTKPDAVIVMDNLAAHKASAVADRIQAAGFTHLYLPRYSPDLSPIEPAWAKVKSQLRANAARTLDALAATLGPALDSITPQDACGFFRHCGYPIN